MHDSVPWLCDQKKPGSGSGPGPMGSAAGASDLAQRLLDRINEASGPYQMFEFLGDLVLFEQNQTTKAGKEVFLNLCEDLSVLANLVVDSCRLYHIDSHCIAEQFSKRPCFHSTLGSYMKPD